MRLQAHGGASSGPRRGLAITGSVRADEIPIDHRQHEGVPGGTLSALVPAAEAGLDLALRRAAIAAQLVAVITGLVAVAQAVATHGAAYPQLTLGLAHAGKTAVERAIARAVVAALAAFSGAIAAHRARAQLARHAARKGVLSCTARAAAVSRLGVAVVTALVAQAQAVAAH